MGKAITFSATDAQITASPQLRAETDDYTFSGSTYNKQQEGCYILNTNGNAFTYQDKSTCVEPFRACIIPTGNTTLAQSIVIEDATSGIGHTWVDGTWVNVYTITGTKVGETRISGSQPDMHTYPQGIYIVGGRKVVKGIR